jgi:hypothetical protein
MSKSMISDILVFLATAKDDAEWAKMQEIDPELQTGRIDAYDRVREYLLHITGRDVAATPVPPA